MKSLLLIAVQVFTYTCILPQQITEEYKLYLLENAEKGEPACIGECVKYGISEVKEIIETRFNSFDNYGKGAAISALYHFNSDSTLIFAERFYDQLKAYLKQPNPKDEIFYHLCDKEFYIEAVEIMVKKGNYSHVDEIINFIDSKNISYESYKYFLEAIYVLPQYRNYVKSKLISVITNYSVPDFVASLNRIIALSYFKNYFGRESIIYCKEMLNNDIHQNNRQSAVDKLITFRDSEIIDYLLQNITVQSDPNVRLEIVIRVLLNTNSPKDYYLVNGHYNNEQKSPQKVMMDAMFEYFKPLQPDSSVGVIEILDSLRSYNTQLRNYGWIPNDSLAKESNSKIDTILTLVQSNNSKLAVQKLSDYEHWVENLLNTKAIKPEAYKFLYYTAAYAKARLS